MQNKGYTRMTDEDARAWHALQFLETSIQEIYKMFPEKEYGEGVNEHRAALLDSQEKDRLNGIIRDQTNLLTKQTSLLTKLKAKVLYTWTVAHRIRTQEDT